MTNENTHATTTYTALDQLPITLNYPDDARLITGKEESDVG